MNICIDPVPIIPSPGLSDKRVIPMANVNGQIRPLHAGETLDPCTIPPISALSNLVPVYGIHDVIIGYMVGP